MFSSLASFIFGSNTFATTNCEENNQQSLEQQRKEHEQELKNENENLVRIDAENTINVTLSTPSVTGSLSTNETKNLELRRQQQQQQGEVKKRNNNKNKRNKVNRNRRQAQKPSQSITKLLTPTESCGEDLEEDGWFIVDKDDEEDSLPRTDSEEEISVVESKCNNSLVVAAPTSAAQRRRQHINSLSHYSGPRNQQQHNLLQRVRNSGARIGFITPNASTLSLPRHVANASMTAGIGIPADVEYISANASSSGNELGTNVNMEESWFITPPPCFTSIGPINMETSPYENLLIEHPSMSVYHSIRSAQEAAESFVSLELGDEETHQRRYQSSIAAAVSVAALADAPVAVRNPQAAATQKTHNTSPRAVSFTAAQLKQALLERSSQKSHDKQERQFICRGAIKRANKARDCQSRNNRQRRSDMQHFKLVSGANNNRKCCF